MGRPIELPLRVLAVTVIVAGAIGGACAAVLTGRNRGRQT